MNRDRLLFILLIVTSLMLSASQLLWILSPAVVHRTVGDVTLHIEIAYDWQWPLQLVAIMTAVCISIRRPVLPHHFARYEVGMVMALTYIHFSLLSVILRGRGIVVVGQMRKPSMGMGAAEGPVEGWQAISFIPTLLFDAHAQCSIVVAGLATWLIGSWWRRLKRQQDVALRERCHGCGYPMVGLQAGYCPECGQSLHAQRRKNEM